MYVIDELSYDKFHENAENIYRIGLQGKVQGQEIQTSNSNGVMIEAMHREIPGVLGGIRVRQIGDIVFKYEEKGFAEEQVFFADSNFFEFFSFDLEKGEASTVLDEPNTVVLTQETAEKYFSEEDPIGKMLAIGNDETAYKVTGIAKKAPSNSLIKFDAILSMKTIEEGVEQNGWVSNFLHNFYLKDENTRIEDIDTKLDELTYKYVGPELERMMGINFDEFIESGGEYGYYSYPLLDTHLKSGFTDDLGPNGDITYVYIFGAVGAFILLIACINFMNLSTARSAGRAKEVGMRKTLGSYRQQLIGQFLSESILYSLVSALLAVGVAYLTLPQFNYISGKEIIFSDYVGVEFFLGIVIVSLMVGVIAGSYPAFYLTSFEPVEVLRGKVKAGMKSQGVRSFLVVFQFWISIMLIVCTAVVYQQLIYMQNKNLGFDKHNVMVVRNANRLDNNRMPFKNAIENNSNIKISSYTNNVFPGVGNTTVFRDPLSETDHLMGSYFADYDHQQTMNFELVEGRFFSKDFPSDSTAVLINEAAMLELGWESIDGKELTNYFGAEPSPDRVIGVIKDFNFESLKLDIRPLVLSLTERANNLMIRYEGSSKEAVEATEMLWQEHASGETFEYEFLDENYDALFRAEERLGSIFSIFTALAIFIACLGLFALASFMAEQRTKEIGIRKAMGATIPNLASLLSKEFTKLVIIAFVLSIFPSYYFMNKWLDGFAYKQDIGVWLFIGAGVLSLLIALITVSYQALRAAVSNPVDSLQYE
jgi:putative ABC transport system permease protein